ncbi:membrane-associated protein, putative [Bodo saltans]|uniref:Membrane-associated protein, putative n=1 Tax=Bodo saltans TaxID=75058 RepID=A0A0S4JUI5_BODSA|nr:membrane-associated protein, putative [Bodo saltans]|eukprot:CUG92229.1 membrane-associated protein, putative [Bodo saltans]
MHLPLSSYWYCTRRSPRRVRNGTFLLTIVFTISLFLAPSHSFLSAALVTIGANCDNVDVTSRGTITIDNPGSVVTLLTVTGQQDIVITQSDSNSPCYRTTLTINANALSLTSRYSNSLTIQFGACPRNIVFVGSIFLISTSSNAAITATGTISFPSVLTLVGSVFVSLIGNSFIANQITAGQLVGGGTFSSTKSGGGNYSATLGTLNSMKMTLAGLTALTMSSGASWTSSTISLQGITNSRPTTFAFIVTTAALTFSISSSTVAVSRADNDPGDVNLFTGITSLAISSSTLQFLCADTSVTRSINVAMPSSSQTDTFASSRFTMWTGAIIGTNFVMSVSSSTRLVPFSLTFTSSAIGSSFSRIRIDSTVAPSSSIASTSCIGTMQTNVLMEGNFVSSQLTLEGNQINLTLPSATVLVNSGITISSLGTSGVSVTCVPSAFYLTDGAILNSTSFVMCPYALGVGVIQSGVVLTGATTISIAPLSSLTNLPPANVTVSAALPFGSSLISYSLSVTFTPQGLNDMLMFTNFETVHAGGSNDYPIDGLSGTRIVFNGKSCANQQLVLLSSSPSQQMSSSSSSTIISNNNHTLATTIPIAFQRLTIVATNIGPGITIPVGSTLTDVTISVTSTGCTIVQPQLSNITFMGMTSLTFDLPSSMVQINILGCSFVSGGTTAIMSRNIVILDASSPPPAMNEAAYSRPSLVISGGCSAGDPGASLLGLIAGLSITMYSVPAVIYSLPGGISNSSIVHTTICSSTGQSYSVTINASSLLGSTIQLLTPATPNAANKVTVLIAIPIVTTRSFVSHVATCTTSNCRSSSVATTIAVLALSDNSAFSFSDTTALSNLLPSLVVLNASAVGNSSFSATSFSMNNSLGGFGLISNSTVSLINTNSDLDAQAFATGSNLVVQAGSVITLKGFNANPFSSCASCDFTVRPSAWLSGTSLQLDAPRLNLAIVSGTLLTFTLRVTRIRALSLSANAIITLVNCSFQLSSSSNSYDYQLASMPQLLVMNATTFTWTAQYIEAILPWVSATTAQVKMYSGTQITLSAVSCTISSYTTSFTPIHQLPMPGTTLDVQFPSSGCTTIVTVAGLAAAGSTLRLRSTAIVTVTGAFTSNTTFFVSSWSNAFATYTSLLVTNNSTVTIDLTNIVSPQLLLDPFMPLGISQYSRLEIIAPQAIFSNVWTVSGISITSASSILFNVPNLKLTVAALTGVGCSFTIIASTITSQGKALGNNANAQFTVTSTLSSPPALNIASVVTNSGYVDVTLFATVANANLVDSLVVGLRMLNSNITVLGPMCSLNCNNTFLIDGSFLTASSIGIRVLGRFVTVTNFNITTRNNTASITAREIFVLGSDIVDSTLSFAVITSPTTSSFQPRSFTRSNISITLMATATISTGDSLHYSIADSSFWTLLLGSVTLREGSSIALTSQYLSSSGAILTPSQIPGRLCCRGRWRWWGCPFLCVRG